jgi:hypothetical protein
MAKAPDRWHRWLMDVRFGGDPAAHERVLTEFLYPVRDTVLDKAKLQPGDTVLDVGTGDGLIAFGALEQLSPSGHVVFSAGGQARSVLSVHPAARHRSHARLRRA